MLIYIMHIPPPISMPYNRWDLFQVHLNWIIKNTRNKPAFLIPLSDSPYWAVMWISKGSIVIHAGNQKMEAKAGEWICRQPGKRYYTVSANTHYLAIFFSIQWKGGGRLIFPPQTPFWKLHSTPELERKTQQLYQSVQQDIPAPTERMQIEEINMSSYFQHQRHFYDWFTEWEKECRRHHIVWSYANKMDEKLIHAIRHMEEISPYQSIRIDRIARSLGISTVHLIRLFQQHYGTSPKAYFMKIRLRQAIQEIQTTADEFKVIASRFGYSPAWFGVWIKQETGKTPSELRKTNLTKPCVNP
jgi:AraC-like DNA-binding protein